MSTHSSNTSLSMRGKRAQANSHTFPHVVAREATQVGLGRTRLRSQATEGAGEDGQRSQQEPAQGIALPALRAGAPGRLLHRRGATLTLDTAASRELALQVFDREVHAASSGGSFESRIRTASRLLAPWGIPLLPLSVDVVRCVGAALKAGHYRSAHMVLSAISIHAERQGQALEAPIRRALRDAKRSCLRGIGPPHKMREIPIELLQRLPRAADPLHARGPLAPRRALIAGSWWLTREVELATARAALIRFRKGPLGLEATWSLPASKADPAALGTMRTHGCCCKKGTLAEACPSHTLWAQRADLRSWFPERHSSEGIPSWDLPLFPTSSGSRAPSWASRPRSKRQRFKSAYHGGHPRV